MTRQEVLDRASERIRGRADVHGPPEHSFERIAALWSAYMGHTTFTPSHVAAMLALLKIARVRNNEAALDSWVDLAGYAACGAELAEDDDEDPWYTPPLTDTLTSGGWDK